MSTSAPAPESRPVYVTVFNDNKEIVYTTDPRGRQGIPVASKPVASNMPKYLEREDFRTKLEGVNEKLESVSSGPWKVFFAGGLGTIAIAAFIALMIYLKTKDAKVEDSAGNLVDAGTKPLALGIGLGLGGMGALVAVGSGGYAVYTKNEALAEWHALQPQSDNEARAKEAVKGRKEGLEKYFERPNLRSAANARAAFVVAS